MRLSLRRGWANEFAATARPRVALQSPPSWAEDESAEADFVVVAVVLTAENRENFYENTIHTALLAFDLGYLG